MFELIIGKTKTHKTTHIKKRLSELDTPVIILDFKKEYDDVEDAVIFDLGEINPFSSPMDFQDAIAVNAATFEYRTYLEDRAKDVLQYLNLDEDWKTHKRQNLIREALDRSLNTWDQIENSFAMDSRKYLYFNKSKQVHTLDEVLEQVHSKDRIILQSNGLHSTESRIVLFLLLSSIQRSGKRFTLVSDNLNFIWKDGHLKNFARVFDFSAIDCIFSYNKTSNIPKFFYPLADQYKIFRLDNNNDYVYLNKMGLNLPASVKNLKPGSFYEVTAKEKSSATLSNASAR